MDKYSFLGNTSTEWIEEQYEKYRKNPESIAGDWAHFFAGFDFSKEQYGADGAIPENVVKEFRVLDLIQGYRSRGHLFTKTNPVRERRKYSPTLDIENFGLEEGDLDTVFQAGEDVGLGPVTLREIIDHLVETYCQSIGIEYNYIRHPERVKWIRENIELKNRPQFTIEEKRIIFNMLNRATAFEQFLQKKFVGQKRFSMEGGEALMPALHALVQRGSRYGVTEMVFGMAHRGRLNILGNIFKKEFKRIFSEFAGKEYEDDGIEEFDGDVKYHLGYSTVIKADDGKPIRCTMAPNPSHLEAVSPVVQGLARAKIDNELHDEHAILPILIHGDAAIAGQGVIYEVIQMAQLQGYRAGGTIHIVINNQVGFTTNYLDGRSSTYCTDVAKVTLSPVFHVNGDDIEAVVQTLLIAFQYRQEFGRDVFVDLLCYRKYGHNEGDEPKFTQPKLYDIISNHPNPREIYQKELLDAGVISKKGIKTIQDKFDKLLEDHFELAKDIPKNYVRNFMEDTWSDMVFSRPVDFETSPDTSYDKKKLTALAKKFNTLAKDKTFFRKVQKLMKDRLKMVEEDRLDWAMGELLAYATLLEEGHPVRISGQDVERGTFSHRHAVIKTEDAEETYLPLNHLSETQGKFTIYNSLLSEYAVLGFDYGYAFATPQGLTVWEAQFGDFFNGAQIVIDQFISAAEVKWRAMNGIVMLLPHGYEGQGSEHSSARIERFLQQCAEYNMQVCNATTPANYFHLLRRQLKRQFRKPLVVFTPKKLLRYPKAVSTMAEMAEGRFKEVLDDPNVKVKDVDTVVLCSGKIYYEILEEKEKTESGENMAVVRVEQLYPLPQKQLNAVLKRYTKAKHYIWMQEEPANMGAWYYMAVNFRDVKLECIAPNPTASPAPGSSQTWAHRHKANLDNLFKFAKQPVK
ncbi:MAG: 2-oxoglutarate dehydrogenase E1 component [Cryomorphaceae bacterium]